MPLHVFFSKFPHYSSISGGTGEQQFGWRRPRPPIGRRGLGVPEIPCEVCDVIGR